MIEICRIDSPIGELTIAARGSALCAVAFEDGDDSGRVPRMLEARFPGEPIEEVPEPRLAGALRAYFDGDVRAIDYVTVDMGGTPFRRRAWDAMRRIAAGSTVSYGDLARAAGAPGAVRALGTACAVNPVPIVVPCHRVVRTGGALGGYGGRPDRKRWLIEHERRSTA